MSGPRLFQKSEKQSANNQTSSPAHNKPNPSMTNKEPPATAAYNRLFQRVFDNINPRSDQMYESCSNEFNEYIKTR